MREEDTRRNKTDGNDDSSDTEPSINTDPMNIDADEFDAVATGGTDADGEPIENSDGTVVAVKRDGLGALADGEDPIKCVECGATFENERGVKSHYGQTHKTDRDETRLVDDPAAAIEAKDPDPDTGAALGGDEQSLDGYADEKRKAGKDADALWGEAEWRYVAARQTSTDIARPDARDAVADAVEAETDWISVRERSSPGSQWLAYYDEDDDRWVQDDAENKVMDRAKERLGSVISKRETEHVIDELASRNRVSEAELNGGDTGRVLLPVKNGTLDVTDAQIDGDGRLVVDTVDLCDARKDDYWMYRIDAEWNPGAADLDGLDEWVEEVTHSDDGAGRATLWEFSGHALHPEYPVDGFMTILGAAGSGKSMFIALLEAMLGEENTTSRSIRDIQKRFGKTGGLLDKSANLNTELTGTKISDISTLKAMTAAERVFVEAKGEDGYEQRNTATLIFTSDNPPALPNQNAALGRRLYPIEFPHRYVRDPDPENPFELQRRPKLEVKREITSDERVRAALVRAVEGLVRLLQNGEFALDAETDWEARVERYNTYADPVTSYRSACLKHEPGAVIHAHDLKTTFDRYADLNGLDGKDMQVLIRQLERLDIPIKKDRSRAYTDGSSKDTVYKDIAFTGEAVRFFVPEDAHWDELRYRDYADLTGDDGDGDDETQQTGLDTDTDGDGDGDESGESRDALDAVRDAVAVFGDGGTSVSIDHAHAAIVGAGHKVTYSMQKLKSEGEVYVTGSTVKLVNPLGEDEQIGPDFDDDEDGDDDPDGDCEGDESEGDESEGDESEGDESEGDEPEGDEPEGESDDDEWTRRELSGNGDALPELAHDDPEAVEARVIELVEKPLDNGAGARLTDVARRVTRDPRYRVSHDGPTLGVIERLVADGELIETTDGRVAVPGGPGDRNGGGA